MRVCDRLASLSELNVSRNELEQLPASIGCLRHLRTFYADENRFSYLPPEVRLKLEAHE